MLDFSQEKHFSFVPLPLRAPRFSSFLPRRRPVPLTKRIRKKSERPKAFRPSYLFLYFKVIETVRPLKHFFFCAKKVTYPA